LSKKDYLNALIKNSFSLLVKNFLFYKKEYKREQAAFFFWKKNDSLLKGINQ